MQLILYVTRVGGRLVVAGCWDHVEHDTWNVPSSRTNLILGQDFKGMDLKGPPIIKKLRARLGLAMGAGYCTTSRDDMTICFCRPAPELRHIPTLNGKSGRTRMIQIAGVVVVAARGDCWFGRTGWLGSCFHASGSAMIDDGDGDMSREVVVPLTRWLCPAVVAACKSWKRKECLCWFGRFLVGILDPPMNWRRWPDLYHWRPDFQVVQHKPGGANPHHGHLRGRWNNYPVCR